MKRKRMVAAALAGMILLCTACGQEEETAEEEAPGGTAVEVTEVTAGSMSASYSLTGKVAAVNEVQVYPLLAGQVLTLAVGEGDTVRQGQTLLTVDTSTVTSTMGALQQSYSATRNATDRAIESAQLSVEQAQIGVDQAQQAVDNAEALYEAGAAAEQDVTQARQALQQAQASLAQAQAGVAQLMDRQIEALGEAAGVIGRKPVLVLATGNFGKVKELRAMLGGRFDVRSMREMGAEMDVEETGETFEENALLKAEVLMRATGCAALADDSGLMVDALGGRPGVYSARYCGVHGDDEANNQLLLKELEDVPEPRTARYAAAVALCRPGHEPLVTYGTCEGEILREYRGEGGFGYDPLFFSDDLQMTLAEAAPEAKNAISHRARAVEKLLKLLEAEDA